MDKRRQCIGRRCHRAGLALGVLFLAAGSGIVLYAQGIADRDDRNEMIGAGLAFCAAAVLVYLVARVIGWVAAEFAD